MKRHATARGIETREKILTAGMELIWKVGYGACTIEQVCVRAGVLKGSFYHCFESKEAMAVAALESSWGGRRMELDRIFSAGRPALERLELYFANTLERQAEFQRREGRVPGCPYFCAAAEVGLQDNAVAAKSGEIVGQYCRYFESALRDAQADGLVELEDPLVAARGLFSFVEGALTQARVRNDLDL